MGKNRILKGVYMNQLIKMDEEYRKWIEDIGKRYKQRQIKASVSVNQEMIGFYWSIGRDIVEKSAESKWGSGFFVNLSKDMRTINFARGSRLIKFESQIYEEIL